jgi:hypothetical protein
VCAQAGAQSVSREYVRLNGRVIAIEIPLSTPPPPTIPALVSLSPTGGSGVAGTAQVFTAVVSDPAGAADIQLAQYWMNSSAGSCHLAYYASVSQIYLDSSSTDYNWVGNGAPGAAVWLSSTTVL